MKRILKIFALSLMLQSFQCDKENNSNTITSQQLKEKHQNILNYVSDFSCSQTTTCNYIGVGSKACGGFQYYLAFPNTVDLPKLQAMIAEYNNLEKEYNIQNGVISDCSVATPPNTIDCVEGVCKIIN